MPNWSLFDFVFLVVFIISFIIRVPHEKVNRNSVITKSKFDSLEKIGLFFVGSGALIFPLIYLFTPLFNFANYNVNPWTASAGAILSIPGLWLFWRSHNDLGRQFSPKLEIKESHALITEGVYKHIRHPMYSASLLNSISQLLLIGNWIVAPSYLLSFSFLYLTRVKREEALMLKQFGESYKNYMNNTNRLFPKYLE